MADPLARPVTATPVDRRARLAVIGGGWAGLAAAVEAIRAGDRVTVFEMAPRLGGRARSLDAAPGALDNGQHILIGAYVQTLRLLKTLEVDAGRAFLRTPLTLVGIDGRGLRLPPGPPSVAFARAVLAERRWPVRERLALLAAGARWTAAGFRCAPSMTVAMLTAGTGDGPRRDLIEPLCVAALNTEARAASASTFLRVLRDALFSGRGSADLLLPRVGLSELVPEAARRHFESAGAELRSPARIGTIEPGGGGWSVDGEAFDRVVVAAGPVESARLARPWAPAWAAQASALEHEPIVTVYLQAGTVRLPFPMLALEARDANGDDPGEPAQFVFDRGQLGGPPGLLAFVISGAGPWIERGKAGIEAATLGQARRLLGSRESIDLRVLRTITERRATFRCTPELDRPPMRLAEACHAAGDHVDGPYPATLEGAVRSGLEAARAFRRP